MVQLAAPGCGILSTYVGDDYELMDGTSMVRICDSRVLLGHARSRGGVE